MTSSKAETSAAGLKDAETWEEGMDCLTEPLEIPMQGACAQKTLFEILVRAASQNESVEQTCNTLEDVPGGNNVRYHLEKLEEREALEHEVKEALQSRIPPRIRGGKQKVAIDLTLIP